MAQAEATDGPFTLTFKLPRTTWSASEPIVGRSSLAVAADVEVGGSGEGLLGFQYDDIWTITALASFTDFAQDQGCKLPSHELSAPITIHVTT